MTHEEEMAKLRAETEYYRKQNDEMQKKIENQMNEILKRVKEI